MKLERHSKNAIYGIIVGIVFLTLLLSQKNTPKSLGFTGLVPSSSSNSDLDVVIHAGHYISRMKGSTNQSGLERFKELHSLFKGLIENNSLKLGEKDATFFFTFTKELEKYIDFRTLRSAGINQPLFWPTLLDGQNSPIEILNEKSQQMVPESHLKWWELSSKALSMNPFSRFVSLSSVFGVEDNAHMTSLQASHLRANDRCAWNPFGPPPTACMSGEQNTTAQQGSANQDSAQNNTNEEAGHLLLSHYFETFPISQEMAPFSLVKGSKAQHMLDAFQSGGSDAVATSLFLEKAKVGNFRAATLTCFEIARLRGSVDQEDNLFARHLELLSRRPSQETNDNRGSFLSEEAWLKVASEGWPM